MPDALPGEINHDALDRFTLAHFGAGAVMGLLRLPWWSVVVVALGWELLERPLKRRAPGMFPHNTQDTAQNAIVDAGALILGAAVARWVAKHA